MCFFDLRGIEVCHVSDAKTIETACMSTDTGVVTLLDALATKGILATHCASFGKSVPCELNHPLLLTGDFGDHARVGGSCPYEGNAMVYTRGVFRRNAATGWRQTGSRPMRQTFQEV